MEQGEKGPSSKGSADSILLIVHCTFRSSTHRLLRFLWPLGMYNISVFPIVRLCKTLSTPQEAKEGKILLSFNFYLYVSQHYSNVTSFPFWPCWVFLGIENLYERALYIRKILLTIPRSVLIVMRYLFAFLNQ